MCCIFLHNSPPCKHGIAQVLIRARWSKREALLFGCLVARSITGFSSLTTFEFGGHLGDQNSQSYKWCRSGWIKSILLQHPFPPAQPRWGGLCTHRHPFALGLGPTHLCGALESLAAMGSSAATLWDRHAAVSWAPVFSLFRGADGRCPTVCGRVHVGGSIHSTMFCSLSEIRRKQSRTKWFTWVYGSFYYCCLSPTPGSMSNYQRRKQQGRWVKRTRSRRVMK